MAKHRWSNPEDVLYDEFETRRRIAAIEHDLDDRWKEQRPRPTRSRRLRRQFAERWE